MNSAKVNGVELEYEVRRLRRARAADQSRSRRRLPAAPVGTGAGRTLPADQVPQARLGRQHAHPAAGERRGPRRRRGRAARRTSTCRARTSPATRAARRSPPSWPSTTPRRCTRSPCWSRRCSRCPAARRSSRRRSPAFEAYGGGDHEGAFAIFMSAASGLEWEACRAAARGAHSGRGGAVDQGRRHLLRRRAARPDRVDVRRRAGGRDSQAALSVLGAETQPLWVEVAELLRSSLPHIEECTIDGAGHLLHIQRPEPVARAMAEFLAGNPLPATEGAPDTPAGLGRGERGVLSGALKA